MTSGPTHIQTYLERQLDKESHAKLLQVLEFIGDAKDTLFARYNNHLVRKLNTLGRNDYTHDFNLDHHVKLMISFYSFRLIAHIGQGLTEKVHEGAEKAEEHLVLLIKVLFHHGLVSKSFTANLALVELESLCRASRLTMSQLYQKHKTRFLRIIIKAILHRLSNMKGISKVGNNNGSGNMHSVITYMTRAFEIFNVSIITADDIAQSLIIITNLIQKDKYTTEIGLFLGQLANYQNIDCCTLVRMHIQTILVTILLRRKMSQYDMTEALKKLCSYFGKKPQDVLATKFTNIKGKLLLYYSTAPQIVTESIYYLSTFEKSVMDQPFEDEFEDEAAFIDYLKPSMIGILFGIDQHFTSISRDLGFSQSIDNIRSLGKLIAMLDKEHIRTIHHKLLSTLSLLIRLRPTRDNQELNQAIINVWIEFTSKLERSLKDSLLINICVALHDLIEDAPDDVSKIYSDLIKCDRPKLRNHSAFSEESSLGSEGIEDRVTKKLKCLFFIPNRNGFQSIYDLLTSYVHRSTTSNDLQDLSKALEGPLPLMKYENHKCHVIAITRIRELLKSNQHLLTSSMLVNLDEPIGNTITKTIEMLLALSSTQDNELSAMIAECLGVLGAINPIRLDNFIYGGLNDNRIFMRNLHDENFIVQLIERLKKSLFSDRMSESETANYALQVVVKQYDIFGKSLKNSLSDEAIQACNLCKDTSYAGTKRSAPDIDMPLYTKFKMENQYSYKEWLDKFSLILISSMVDPFLEEVLHACTYIFKHNVKFAEFILPMMMLHIITEQPDTKDIIAREFMAILTEDIGLSSQDLDIVYSDNLRSSLQTLHFQCANMMFCVLDSLTRLEMMLSRTKSPSSQDCIRSIKEFTSLIPKDKLALLSSRCRAPARALYYFDQYYFDKKHWFNPEDQKPTSNEFDKYWTELQKIYMALDESFEAAGIENVRTTHTTLKDDIANYESLGKFDKAFVCYDALLNSLDDKIDKKSICEDSLKCLANQGDYQRLYEWSQQLTTKYPQCKRSFIPAASEALWQLAKWDELDLTLANEQIETLLESPSISQGYLLISLKNARNKIPDRLKLVRSKLMKPLSIAMIDRSAYFRGYQSLLMLHQIEDFSLAVEVLETHYADTQAYDENSVEQIRVNMTKRFVALFQTWSKRNKLVEPTLRSLEPLLSWQRSIVQALISRYPFLQPQINIDVGKMWLTSANVARESRCFDRAFYCLTQAQKNFGCDLLKSDLDLNVKITIERAKLDWDQGESTRAIRGLKAAIQRFRNHDLYEHLESRRFVIEESRRRTSELSTEEPYPDLNGRACEDCDRCVLSERESFARIMILLTRYCEDAAAGTPKTLLGMYEQCVHLGVNQEEILLHLARYYDKLATHYSENPHVLKLPSNLEIDPSDRRQSRKSLSQERLERQMAYREEIITKLMEQSILAFGNSLKYGVRYLEESMPRMLNIWLDLGSKKCTSSACLDASSGNISSSRTSFASPPRSISSRIENTVRFIDTILPRKENSKGLPSYYFMSALSLLLSRVHHPHSGVCEKTNKILEQLTIDYPHQMPWYLAALMNDDSSDRRRAADKIIKGAIKREPKITSLFNDNKSFVSVLEKICIRLTPYDDRGDPYTKQKLKDKSNFVTIDDIDPSIKKLKLKQMKVITPNQASMRPIFPTENDRSSLMKYNVFPDHYMTFINEFEPKCRIYNSLQAPKQVIFKCRNGLRMSIICKSGDDLRKDSRCTEFFDLLNKILRRSSQSSVRFFEVPSYLVLPLRNQVGLIEMIPNCETLRSLIDAGYRQRGWKGATLSDGLKKRQRKSEVPDYQVYKSFIRDALPSFTPPVLSHVLKSRFVEPTSWYMARVAYIRSTAAISMGGYIIGLGDRHLDNILIDITQGRVVHVDFNLLFHQGESLAVPEIVPFRLTQNIVSALGPMEKEGKFRKFCEIAMRVMRVEKELLLTTLKPFLHDPCVDWVKQREGNKSMKQLEEREGNLVARDRIRVVEDKLKGFPRSSIHRPLNVLSSHSVESQVDILIDEASDIYNISQMYFGWCPNI